MFQQLAQQASELWGDEKQGAAEVPSLRSVLSAQLAEIPDTESPQAVSPATVQKAVDIGASPVNKEIELSNVDFNFLRSVEGFKTAGYVPKKGGAVIGESGVTVASGLDLGQQSVKLLSSYGLPPELVSKLRPYVGVKKDKAVDLLSRRPLQLTEQEAELVNEKVKTAYVNNLKKKYDASTKGAKFDELPASWQTAIASVAFQYGDLSKAAPNFWRQVTGGDWRGAYSNLRNFGDQFKKRRHQEARLVAADLDWDKGEA